MTTPTKGRVRLLTIEEAAAALAVSVRTVRRLITARNLVAHRIGRCIRVSEEEISRYLHGGRT